MIEFHVLVCGGRNFANRPFMADVLDNIGVGIANCRGITEIIHGGCSGADTLAGDWAMDRGVALRIFPALWWLEGRSAGPKRNRAMLDYLMKQPPERLVVCFPGGRGTDNMRRLAEDAGVQVLIAGDKL